VEFIKQLKERGNRVTTHLEVDEHDGGDNHNEDTKQHEVGRVLVGGIEFVCDGDQLMQTHEGQQARSETKSGSKQPRAKIVGKNGGDHPSYKRTQRFCCYLYQRML